MVIERKEVNRTTEIRKTIHAETKSLRWVLEIHHGNMIHTELVNIINLSMFVKKMREEGKPCPTSPINMLIVDYVFSTYDPCTVKSIKMTPRSGMRND